MTKKIDPPMRPAHITRKTSIEIAAALERLR